MDEMPRFFFNIRTKDDVIEDKVGRHFPSIQEARQAAIIDAKLLIDALFAPDEIRGIVLEICDEAGDVIDTAELGPIFCH